MRSRSPAPLSAQDPSIVTHLTFPTEGEGFGTFTAAGTLCPSGTFVDEFVGGGGAFANGRVFYHALTVRKTFQWADNSGTFTILFHPQFTGCVAGGLRQRGPFAVVGGTGAYAELRGHGDLCVVFDGDEGTETFTGTFTLG